MTIKVIFSANEAYSVVILAIRTLSKILEIFEKETI
jgi:hypothetical protein